MSSAACQAGLAPYYVFVVIILLVLLRVVRRTFANHRGTPFSFAKTIVFAGVYVALGIVFSTLSFFGGVPYVLALPELVLASVAAFWSYRYTDRRISFWRSSEGRLFFRGGIAIYLIYVAGLIARLSIDVVFVGPSMFDFVSTTPLGGSALYGSMAADLLLIFGVGLLIGRNLRVARRHRRIQRDEDQVAEAQPPPRTEA